MTKPELKELLKIYSKIRDAVINGDSRVVIKRYRGDLCINVPPWAKSVEKGICELLDTENELIKNVIDLSYIKGLKDKEILTRLPLSESGYYRLKNYIEEKIFQLCIVFGYVTKADVLSEKIR